MLTSSYRICGGAVSPCADDCAGERVGRVVLHGLADTVQHEPCKDCRRQLSVLTGTVLHGKKIPVRTWCLVVIEMCASKNSVSAREIERKYDLTPKTAVIIDATVTMTQNGQSTTLWAESTTGNV
jgi:hypothetical protein